MTSVADRDNPSTRLDEATVLELITENAGGGSSDVTDAVDGDTLAKIREAADTEYRLIIGLDSAGKPHVLMGNLDVDGSQPQDIKLTRFAPGVLLFEGSDDDVPTFLLSAPFASAAIDIQRDGDGVPRARLREDSVLFGAGSGSLDSRIKRTAAKTITIDDNTGGSITLNILGTLEVNGTALFSNPMTSAGDIIYESGGVDQARTGTASSATGTAGGSAAPSAAIDGNDATWWSSGAEAVANIDLEVDLGSAKTISQWRALMVAYSGFGAPGGNVLLQSSPDGTTWTTQDTYTNHTVADTSLRNISPVSARYWRLLSVTAFSRFNVYTFSLFDAVVPARLAKGTASQILVQGASAPAWQSPARVDAVLGADVTMTTNGTAYDGPSGSFAAGTWDFFWKICFVNGSAGVASYFAKLWDGTTIFDEAEVTIVTNGYRTTISGHALGVVLAATSTVKLTASGDSASSGAKMARDGGNGTSHTLTRLSGIKIA